MKETTPENPQDIRRRIQAIQTLGLPCKVRIQGLLRLPDLGPIGIKLAQKGLEVIDPTRKEKERYHPLMTLLQHERGILEQVFPDAPKTTPKHMHTPPEWLENSPTTEN
jgi:hypothetical protein